MVSCDPNYIVMAGNYPLLKHVVPMDGVLFSKLAEIRVGVGDGFRSQHVVVDSAKHSASHPESGRFYISQPESRVDIKFVPSGQNRYHRRPQAQATEGTKVNVATDTGTKSA